MFVSGCALWYRFTDFGTFSFELFVLALNHGRISIRNFIFRFFEVKNEESYGFCLIKRGKRFKPPLRPIRFFTFILKYRDKKNDLDAILKQFFRRTQERRVFGKSCFKIQTFKFRLFFPLLKIIVYMR